MPGGLGARRLLSTVQTPLPGGPKEGKKTSLMIVMSLTGVRGGHGLGENAVSDGALHVKGKHQRHHDDAVMPYGLHQGLSDKTQWNMDH